MALTIRGTGRFVGVGQRWSGVQCLADAIRRRLAPYECEVGIVLTFCSMVFCAVQYVLWLFAWAKETQPKQNDAYGNRVFLAKMLAACAVLWIMVILHIALIVFLTLRSRGWLLVARGWKHPSFSPPRVSLQDLARTGTVVLLSASAQEVDAAAAPAAATPCASEEDPEAGLSQPLNSAFGGAYYSNDEEDCPICCTCLSGTPPEEASPLGTSTPTSDSSPTEQAATSAAGSSASQVEYSEHTVCRTICGHYYHCGCMANWLAASARARCPLCRHDLRKAAQPAE